MYLPTHFAYVPLVLPYTCVLLLKLQTYTLLSCVCCGTITIFAYPLSIYGIYR